MSNSASAISFHDLRFAYDTHEPVLDIEALEIEKGERVFLHGPSGSGKTTLLSLVSGILTPQSGELHVLGNDLRKLSASQRDTLRGGEMGYIFQSFNLIPYLSVAENIALPCHLHSQRLRRITSQSIQDEIIRLAERLGIEHKLSSPVQELSTGQQQRVAIARAIIGAPSIVIADEPTSALDTDRRDAFLILLEELVAETNSTLLFVSHDLSLASHFMRSLSLPALNRATQEVA